MRKFTIYVSSMTATYKAGEFYDETLNGAIQQARNAVMSDMRGWRFYEVDND